VSVSAVYTREITREKQLAEKEKREPRWFRNPASLVDIDLDDEEECSRAITPEEFARLWCVAEPYQQAYLATLYGGGLRQGELQHLRCGLDLNVENWLVTIQKRGPDPRCTCVQCQDRGWKPKNKNAPRSFHIPEAAAHMRRSIERLLRMYPVEHGDFVFLNPRTRRVWTQKGLQEDFAELCRRAGVSYGRDDPDAITFHSLRHSCATNMLRAGVPLAVVADILGDTPETVSRYYTDLTPHDLGKGIGRTFKGGGAWPEE
jgi:integrase